MRTVNYFGWWIKCQSNLIAPCSCAPIPNCKLQSSIYLIVVLNTHTVLCQSWWKQALSHFKQTFVLWRTSAENVENIDAKPHRNAMIRAYMKTCKLSNRVMSKLMKASIAPLQTDFHLIVNVGGKCRKHRRETTPQSNDRSICENIPTVKPLANKKGHLLSFAYKTSTSTPIYLYLKYIDQ